MSENIIKKAYSPELFQKNGYQIVDLLSDYLHKTQSGDPGQVMQWSEPDEQFDFWKDYPIHEKDLKTFLSDVIQRSNHLHSPKYMGHQVAAPLPVTAITSMMTSLLNNGMAIYEMGPVASALEKWITYQFSKKLGFGNESDGFLTSGGTLATLTALLAARQIKADGNIWKNGNNNQYAILVPAQAHYCIDRAARIMGFGENGIVKVPVDDSYRLRTDLLPIYLKKANKNGKQVIAVVANACSTSTGIYDDLDKVGEFCKQNQLWFHVDAAHGGGAVVSERYKHLLRGVEKADSVIIDLHKMLMMPALATLVLFKNGTNSYRTFNQDAQYLWEKNEDPEWFNYAKRTFECTKLMMSVKFFAILIEHGWSIFDENINVLYDLAARFAEMIDGRSQFELATKPQSNIVCFRLMDKVGDHNKLNQRIRKKVLLNGNFYIVQTELEGNIYLRVTLMNPLSQEKHLKELLNHIEEIAGLLID